MKKIGHRWATNTRYHGYLMASATVLGLFSWWVIYTNKEASGKPHFTSWHSWLGAATMCAVVVSAVGGMVALDVDRGLLKSSMTFRKVGPRADRAAR